MSVRYQLSLRVPTRVDFATRQAWLADPDFMAHNAGWNIDVLGYDPETGCVDWPESQWNAFEERLRRPADEQAYYFVVDLLTGAALGHVHYTVDGGVASIGFNVVPSHRGQGLGSEFLELLLARVREETGATEVVNEFEDERLAAVRVHRAAGFRPDPDVGNVYGRPTRRWRLTVGPTRAEPTVSGVGDGHDVSGDAGHMSHPEWTARPDHPVPVEVARLLGTVPEWFGQPDSNAEYVNAARTKETWTVRDASGEVVGVTLVDRHFPHVVEIHLIVVDRAVHGTGVGTAMLTAIETDAMARGARLLEVKTLGASHPDPGYTRTRHFYEKWGFLPLEETDLWGEDSPCLIMVKPIVDH